jgi:hypothetical protein
MSRILALAIRSARAMLAPWARPIILEYRLEYLPIDRVNPQAFRFRIPTVYRPHHSDYPF